MTQPSYRSPGPDIESIVDAPPTPLARVSPGGAWFLTVRYTATPAAGDGRRAVPSPGGPAHRRARRDLAAHLQHDRHRAARAGYRHRARTRTGSRCAARASASPASRGRPAGTGSPTRCSPTRGSSCGAPRPPTGRPCGCVIVTSMTRSAASCAGCPAPGSCCSSWSPRGAASTPEPPRVPNGPVIQYTEARQAQNRTYQDLLQDAHDDALFVHFTTSAPGAAGSAHGRAGLRGRPPGHLQSSAPLAGRRALAGAPHRGAVLARGPLSITSRARSRSGSRLGRAGAGRSIGSRRRGGPDRGRAHRRAAGALAAGPRGHAGVGRGAR